MTTALEPIIRMSRDIKAAAATLSKDEARYLVNTYYQMQDNRIRADAQKRELEKTGEPHATLSWLQTQNATLENQIKGALGRYAAAHPVGAWAQSICGIGPVISAGLLSNIDMDRAPVCGSIWKFAGLDGAPKKSEKGVKWDYSRDFKQLCAFKIGESFVKVQANEADVYGTVFVERKKLEIARNEAGAFSDQAAKVLESKKIGKATDAYKAYSTGKLPPAHIHARARRYAVKLFLSHLHQVWYWHDFRCDAPKPYAFSHLGHAHLIDPPNFDKRTFPTLDEPRPAPTAQLD
jgi:hypothetical protein